MDGRVIAEVRRGRRGPVEGEHAIGVDLGVDRRPGVPMVHPPDGGDGRPGTWPVEQASQVAREDRSIPMTTPVFGTAQPLRGLSGVVRRSAYRIPEHRARHWILLMVADRVDVLEDRLGSFLASRLAAVGASGAARRIRSDPVPHTLALVTGAVVAGRLLRGLLHLRGPKCL